MTDTRSAHKDSLSFKLAGLFKPSEVVLDIFTFNSGLGNLLDERCESR